MANPLSRFQDFPGFQPNCEGFALKFPDFQTFRGRNLGRQAPFEPGFPENPFSTFWGGENGGFPSATPQNLPRENPISLGRFRSIDLNPSAPRPESMLAENFESYVAGKL